MNDEELLEEYFCLLRRRCRPSNYYATKSSVKKFVRHVREQGLGLREVRPRDAQTYQGELLAAGCGKSHVTTLMTKARAFYEYLKREKMVSSNPFYDVVRIRREEKLPRYIPKEKELEGFLAKLARFEGSAFRGWVSYRAHVASELLYATGMRIGEAARLTVADVDLDKGTVRVRESKNGRSRVCFLSEYARAVIRLYLEKARPVLAREWGEKKQAVLFGMNECVLPETVNAVLVKTAHEAGLPKITCHTFRHAFGSHLLRSGCDIRFIQTLLGHEWLSTTQVYTKVEKEDLRDVLDKCHPRHFVRGRTGEREGNS
jgi:site-specific recombinase XerD